jgi:hypothetical protein
MFNFDFVSDEKFRFSLERDYQELTSSVQVGAWKAAHLLAGSIIEAILADYLLATGLQHTDLLNMALEDAISLAAEKGALSNRAEYIAYTIKSYRNLIHPDRDIRLSENIEEGSAKVVQALVDIVTKEIAEAKKKLYGYTAEQIVNRIIKDSSTHVVLPYLLKNTSEFEKKRLLVEVIPRKYIDYLENSEPGVTHSLSALSKSFYLMFNTVNEQTKKEVAENFVKVIQEAKAYPLYVHQNQFFRGHFLAYLSKEDAKLVKRCLFSLLEEQVNKPIFRTLEGIGEFIEKEDVHNFISPIILSTFKEPYRPSASLEEIGEFLCEECSKMPEDVKEYIRAFLHEDRWSFRNDNDKERLTYLRNLILTPRIWANRFM